MDIFTTEFLKQFHPLSIYIIEYDVPKAKDSKVNSVSENARKGKTGPKQPQEGIIKKESDRIRRIMQKEIKKGKATKEGKNKVIRDKTKKGMYPYIKQRDGNTCISCGKKNLVGMDWHAGHYIKAELCNMITRYDQINIHSQCSNCNLWKRGNTIAYRFAMIAKYGPEIVADLEKNYNKPLPMDFNHREWLLEQIAKYSV